MAVAIDRSRFCPPWVGVISWAAANSQWQSASNSTPVHGQIAASSNCRSKWKDDRSGPSRSCRRTSRAIRAVNGRVVRGDFGVSMLWRRSVIEVIGNQLWLTMAVSFSALFLTWTIALPIGICSAVRQFSAPSGELTCSPLSAPVVGTVVRRSSDAYQAIKMSLHNQSVLA